MNSDNYDPQKKCPICQNSKYEELIDFGLIPSSGTFLPRSNTPFKKNWLSFDYCLTCALIKRRSVYHANSGIDYSLINRSTKKQMPNYLTEIIDYTRKIPLKKSRFVIDVGGNDGSFMDLIADAGFSNRLIIEPSIVLSKICRENGHEVSNITLTSNEAKKIIDKYGVADIIFCRHVIEHVPNPNDFLEALKLLSKDNGFIFLETPDSVGITRYLISHELWDEHLFYYSKEHLKFLVMKFGLHIERLYTRPHRGGANILMWLQNRKSCQAIHMQSNKIALENCNKFKKRWHKFRKRILLAAKNWRKPIGCLGASHPQSNFLIFTGLGNQIDFLVDDDPKKIFSYVPLPKPTPVISTEQMLNGDSVGTLLLTAFGCKDWNSKVRKILFKKGVELIDPYRLVDKA